MIWKTDTCCCYALPYADVTNNGADCSCGGARSDTGSSVCGCDARVLDHLLLSCSNILSSNRPQRCSKCAALLLHFSLHPAHSPSVCRATTYHSNTECRLEFQLSVNSLLLGPAHVTNLLQKKECQLHECNARCQLPACWPIAL
jgi:hypothetical protein